MKKSYNNYFLKFYLHPHECPGQLVRDGVNNYFFEKEEDGVNNLSTTNRPTGKAQLLHEGSFQTSC